MEKEPKRQTITQLYKAKTKHYIFLLAQFSHIWNSLIEANESDSAISTLHILGEQHTIIPDGKVTIPEHLVKRILSQMKYRRKSGNFARVMKVLATC